MGNAHPTLLGWFAAFWLSILLYATGCTTVVIPPKTVREPVPVFLLDNGHHASLVLPAPDNSIVRYAYGDWEYYARVRTGFRQGTAALFRATQGALGRKVLPGPSRAEAVKNQVLVPIEALYSLTVERARAEQLRLRLEEIYAANLDSHLFNPLYDLHFVHHPRPYRISYNSNRAVADWLLELGCQIRGSAMFSQWKVEPRNGS